MAIGPEHDVFRFDVAMNDPPRVRCRQCARHLRGNLDCLHHRYRSALETRAQGFALDELGDDERTAAFVTEIVDDQNVRVIE